MNTPTTKFVYTNEDGSTDVLEALLEETPGTCAGCVDRGCGLVCLVVPIACDGIIWKEVV